MLSRPAVILVLILLQGCATVREEFGRDPRDAPWDPKPGQGYLIDQIPNWDSEALKRCGGRLGPEEATRRGLSTRC